MEILDKGNVTFLRDSLLAVKRISGRVTGDGCWIKKQRRMSFQRDPTQEPREFKLGWEGCQCTPEGACIRGLARAVTPLSPHTPLRGSGTLPQTHWGEAEAAVWRRSSCWLTEDHSSEQKFHDESRYSWHFSQHSDFPEDSWAKSFCLPNCRGMMAQRFQSEAEKLTVRFSGCPRLLRETTRGLLKWKAGPGLGGHWLGAKEPGALEEVNQRAGPNGGCTLPPVCLGLLVFLF